MDTGSGTEAHTSRVVRFCNDNERAGRWWYPTKGYSNRDGKRLPNVWPRDKSSAKKGGFLYVVDTYTAKDLIFERLKRPVGEPGSIHFPSAHIEGSLPIDAKFFKRLTKERPKVVPGQDRTSWADQPSDQEPWDCLVGCYVALEALYTKKGGSKIRDTLVAPYEPPAEPAPAADADAGAGVPPAPPAEPVPGDVSDLPPPGTPPWKMTSAQKAAVAAQRAKEEAAKPQPPRRNPGLMVRSSFVSR